MSDIQESSFPALQAQNLHATLDGRLVIRDLDLSIAAGTWLSIVGPNGAGKSTLLKALAGLMAYQGRVSLLGQELQALPRQFKARKMSWLGQNETAGSDLRVLDVVMLGRLPYQGWLSAPDAQDHAAVERALRATQAWEWRERSLGQLSGGERQRVLLARALAVEADVVLMDEPLANLDPPHQADWLQLVRELVAQGKTVISVLHEITFALRADQVLILADGEIRHLGASDSSDTHRALEVVFDQGIAIHKVQGNWVAVPRCVS